MFKSVEYIDYENSVPKKYRELFGDAKAFNVAIPISTDWRKAKKRVLFVVGHVVSEDLHNRKLLSNNSRKLLNNCLAHAGQLAEPYGGLKDYSAAAINFNFFRNYHLKGDLLTTAYEVQKQRVINFINYVKPDLVIICGAQPSYSILEGDLDLPVHKMGWLRKIKFKGHKCKVVTTVDFTAALEDGKKDNTVVNESEDETQLVGAYQLGFFCRNILSALHGSIPWAKKRNPVKVNYIDTIKKFKKMMAVLNSSKKVAVDTEAPSLNKIATQLLIIQFSVNSKEAYVLPYHHKDTPFKKDELEYIKAELRKFFMKKIEHTTDNYLMMYNAKFDLGLIQQCLEIPFIYWPVYDAQAGEHALDETMTLLRHVVKATKTKVSFGGLAQILTTYGEDFYYSHEFSKSQRDTIVSESLTKPILEYCIDPSMFVETETGKINIQEYINNPLRFGKLLSYNHDTDELEYKDCLSTSVHTTVQDMYEIDYGEGSIKVTEDHEVFSVTRNAYVKAKDLMEDEEITLLGL